MNRVLYILMALMLLSCFPSAQAQNAPGQVQIQCAPAITLDAAPGTDNGSMEVMCTITNPHSEDEEIHLSGTNDPNLSLGFLEGTEFNVSAGESIDVNVTVTADEGIDNATYQVSVTARVHSVNNVPSPSTIEDTSTTLVHVSAYNSYTVGYDAPMTFTVVLNNAGQNIGDSVKLQHNGNTMESFQVNLTALSEALAPHNLTALAPAVTVMVGTAEAEPTSFEILVGSASGEALNTSSWEALQNGSFRLTLSASITVDAQAEGVPCHACAPTVDAQIEIYAVEALDDDTSEGDAVPEPAAEDPVPSVGVFATLAMISLAGIAVGRKHE
ncbi:MAG: hypothetical protein ACPHK3_07875 [Candidatus Poseidoniaceae archaeon]